MLYEAYQTHTDLLYPLRATAGSALTLLEHPGQVLRSARLAYPGSDANARAAAAFELIARAQLTHTRPAFDIDTVVVGGREVAVTEEVIVATPFAQLLRFARDQPGEQPRVLLVAPMSGHFATLLRDTVRTLLADHDVYVTDWGNARDVSLLARRLRPR